jgi:hypothetical protein
MMLFFKAYLPLGRSFGWLVAGLGISVFSMGPAFAADSDKSPKKTRVVAKKQKPEVRAPDTKDGGGATNCLSEGCPKGSRCVVMNERPTCVFGAQSKKGAKVTDTRKGKQVSTSPKKGSKGSGTPDWKERLGPQNAATCMDKRCPPGTQCSLVGGKPQCLMDYGSRHATKPARRRTHRQFRMRQCRERSSYGHVSNRCIAYGYRR